MMENWSPHVQPIDRVRHDIHILVGRWWDWVFSAMQSAGTPSIWSAHHPATPPAKSCQTRKETSCRFKSPLCSDIHCIACLHTTSWLQYVKIFNTPIIHFLTAIRQGKWIGMPWLPPGILSYMLPMFHSIARVSSCHATLFALQSNTFNICCIAWTT